MDTERDFSVGCDGLNTSGHFGDAFKLESQNRFMSIQSETSLPSLLDSATTRPRSTSLSLTQPNRNSDEILPQSRLEFFKTLSLLLKIGSSTLKPAVNAPESDDETTNWQVALHEALWLELKSWHANRTMREQDMFLVQARYDIDAVLDEVIHFKIKRDILESRSTRSGDSSSSDLSSSGGSIKFRQFTNKIVTSSTPPNAQELRAALIQVAELIDKLEAAEQCYPTMRTMGEHHRKYRSDRFNKNLETLYLWLNITKDLYHKLWLVSSIVGVDTADYITWQDWLDAGLGMECFRQTKMIIGSDSDTDSDDEDEADENAENEVYTTSDESDCGTSEDEHNDSQNKAVGFVPKPESISTPNFFQHQTSSTVSSPSGNTHTSRYRPFVDRSIKKMGIPKLGKRLQDLLHCSLTRARSALEVPKPHFDESPSIGPPFPFLADGINSLGQVKSQQVKGNDMNYVRERGVWSQEFIMMGLHSFQPIYLFLLKVCLDIMHECLRLRLEHRPKGEPSNLSIRPLIRECKHVLRGAVLMKQYYLDMVQAVVLCENQAQELIDNAIDEFEQDVQNLLAVYFEYLHSLIHMMQKMSQASAELKTVLEGEWIFTKGLSCYIPGQEAQAARRFCVMAAGLLDSTGDYLESGLDQCLSDLHNSFDNTEDLRRKVVEACRNFKKLYKEARDRAFKALGFAKMLRNDLEIAALFRVHATPAEVFLALQKSNHVQVMARQAGDYLIFVPRDIKTDKRQIIELLKVCSGCTNPDPVACDGYMLIMPAEFTQSGAKPVRWAGEKVLINPTIEVAFCLADLEPRQLILITNSTNQLPMHQRKFRRHLEPAVQLECSHTSRFHAIAEALVELKATFITLRERIIYAVHRVEENLDVDNMVEMEELERVIVHKNYVETMHCCYNFAFEYQKEIFRLVSSESHDLETLKFVRSWMKFVTTKCERGRGTRPRWANQGLEFLTLACDQKNICSLSEEEFQALKTEINNCISHVIGSADVGVRVTSPGLFRPGPLRTFSVPPSSKSTWAPSVASPEDHFPSLSSYPNRHHSEPSFRSRSCEDIDEVKPVFGPGSDYNGLNMESNDVIDDNVVGFQRESSLSLSSMTSLSDSRMKGICKKLEKLEVKRNKLLFDKKSIGRVSDRPRDVAKELVNVKYRKVPFKWQRGNKIGEGQFGVVYSCVNLDNGDLMAMKQIKFQPNDHSAIIEIANEVKSFESIRHESLVKYYGVEVHRDEMLIFMECCTEGTISDVAKLGLPESMIRVYVSQMLVAVTVLHDNGIVHRDIKGANIFISADGLIKLGDFGCAVKLRNRLNTMQGEVNNIRGTVAYMAPEIITQDKEAGYGRAADIWSLGCVVVEMATGKPPWHECDNNWTIMFRVGDGASPPIPENLGSEGQDFISHCFVHNPHERGTASNLLDHPFVKCC